MAGKPRRTDVTDQEIIAHYASSNSVGKTAEALGIGASTAYRVLLSHNVKRIGLGVYRERATLLRGSESAIAADYEAGMTYAELQAKYGNASIYAFKHAIKRAGGILRENPAPLLNDSELERIRALASDGVSQVRISLEIGRSQSFVSRVARRHGISTQQGSHEKHPMWKGGRYADSNGYIRVWIAKDDPMHAMALNDRTVLEHRLVMARKLGRPLLRSETVHHINGDRTDNRLANLELRQGKHGKHIVMCCLDCGSRNVGPIGIAEAA